MTIRSVLVVEDDTILAIELVSTLTDAGYEVVGPVTTSIAAVAAAEHSRPDLVLVDINLADGRKAGVQAARKLRDCGAPCLFMSAHAAEAQQNRFAAMGILEKPFAPEAVIDSIAVMDALIQGEPTPRLPVGLELFGRHPADRCIET
jgi:two-component system, response regulator PdtaR